MFIIMIMKGHVTDLLFFLTVVFLIIFGQQWSSVAQRNELYLAFATQTILVSWINPLLVLVFLWDFFDKSAPQYSYTITKQTHTASVSEYR